jgi:hypothetical protein
MVEGFMAEDAETIPRFFASSAAGAVSLDVLNFGIGASNVFEYFALIRDAVPLFRPRDLILIFYANDFWPDPYQAKWLEGVLESEWNDPWSPRVASVLRSLWAGRRVPRRWFDQPVPFHPAVPNTRNPWSDPAWEAKWGPVVSPHIADMMRRGIFNPWVVNDLVGHEQIHLDPIDMRSALGPLSGFVSAYQATLLVAYLPSRNQVSDAYLPFQHEYSKAPRGASFATPEYQGQARQLAAACAELGVPFLDLTPGIRRLESAGTRLYWDYDEHMRAEGYRFVGETLFAWWSTHRPGAEEQLARAGSDEFRQR